MKITHLFIQNQSKTIWLKFNKGWIWQYDVRIFLEDSYKEPKTASIIP